MRFLAVAAILAVTAVVAANDETPVRTCFTKQWEERLLGKTLASEPSKHWQSNRENIFLEKDLPNPHRILRDGEPVALDYVPNRLDVRVNLDRIVVDVKCE
ncbi:hypothetical protein GGI12_003164 [Dipsacomyces acuminosporus]|nr:hypothetical protein GGI12_003164 [Dipsacomyces acuminosporus]